MYPIESQRTKDYCRSKILVRFCQEYWLWFNWSYSYHVPALGLLSWHSGIESACQFRKHKRHEFNPWVRKIPWRRKWQPAPVLLLGKPHGQRSLAGYSPQGLRVRRDWLTEYTGTGLTLCVSNLGAVTHEIRRLREVKVTRLLNGIGKSWALSSHSPKPTLLPTVYKRLPDTSIMWGVPLGETA